MVTVCVPEFRIYVTVMYIQCGFLLATYYSGIGLCIIDIDIYWFYYLVSNLI